jgi:hypothetical protein
LGDFFKRAAAIKWLIETKPPDSELERSKFASALVPLLDDHFVRREAAAALAIWATRDQVPNLIAALEHEDTQIQVKAAEALRRLNDPRGLAALAEHEKRRDARDAPPPAQSGRGGDLREEMRKFMERQEPGGEMMRKLMERQAQQLGQRPAKSRKRAARQNLIDLAPILAKLNNKDEAVRRGALARLADCTPNMLDHDEVIKALEPLMGDP